MSSSNVVNFSVDEALKKKLDMWPWGTRAAVLRALIEKACDFYDSHGSLGLGAIVDDKVQITMKSDQLVE